MGKPVARWVIRNPGGWYQIEGADSWHGSDDPRYLRAVILTGSAETAERARAVLNFVEANTLRIVRRWRDWKWGRSR